MAAPASVQAQDFLIKRADPAKIAAAYPPKALRAGIDGWVMLQCSVRKTGQFEKCTILEEKPLGYGFGAAALAFGPDYWINLKDPRAGALLGDRVPQDIVFRVDDALKLPAKPIKPPAKPVPPLCPSKKDCMEVN
ncbi:energy transducer TonB [Candidatus Phycosocius spiralis]|nr:energy transducer TonB [Candidatus Phycosocius spiralis]